MFAIAVTVFHETAVEDLASCFLDGCGQSCAVGLGYAGHTVCTSDAANSADSIRCATGCVESGGNAPPPPAGSRDHA